uniref:Uncharacterized protein n=1 Tax=Anguilla anguilla TaxID=7936 RepID=A0A0E9WII8_ANGAN
MLYICAIHYEKMYFLIVAHSRSGTSRYILITFFSWPLCPISSLVIIVKFGPGFAKRDCMVA